MKPELTESAFWSVIPAGGSGTRLWPLSRSSRPKYLLPLIGDRSLIQQTWDRLLDLSPPERILVVAGPAHAEEIERQLPDLPAENLVIEPCPRGTAPAIGLAARLIADRDPNAVMGSFAADHVVDDQTAFERAVATAVQTAAQGWITTIGIEPTRPETGYGYIERTDDVVMSVNTGTAFRAAGFTEKPDLERAKSFIASGRYSWNASMFIWSLNTFDREMQTHLPALWRSLGEVAAGWRNQGEDSRGRRAWESLEPVTIDQGLMERSSRIAVVPAEMGWSDVGDWHGLGELTETDDDGNGLKAKVLQHDSTSSVVWSTTGRLIGLVGVEDLVVIDTPDALLVMPRNRAQDGRKIVEQLTGEFEDLA